MRETVFGLLAVSLEEARPLLERVFAQPLQLHHSAFRGGTYYLLRSEDPEEVVLQRNWDDVDQEKLEQSASEYDLLIFLSTSNPDWVDRLEAGLPLGMVRRIRDRLIA